MSQVVVRRADGLQRITGTQFEVDSQIAAYRAAGRLRSKTRSVPVAGQPNMVKAYVMLSDPERVTTPRLIAAVGVAAFIAAAWLLFVSLPAILGALIGLALIVAGYFFAAALLSDGCEITVIHRRR